MQLHLLEKARKSIWEKVIPDSFGQSSEISSCVAKLRVQELRKQYQAFANSSNNKPLYRIGEAISHTSIDLTHVYKGYSPHPDSLHEQKVINWSSIYGVWSTFFGETYITMPRYLHSLPEISADRLELVGRLYAYLYYINDLYGTAALPTASLEIKGASRQILAEHEELYANLVEQRKLVASDSFCLPFDSGWHGVTKAGREILYLFKAAYQSDNKTFAFVNHFLSEMIKHLKPCMSEQNITASDQPYGIQDYVKSRLNVSGMYITVGFYEFLVGKYLDWDWMEPDYAFRLLKLRELSAWIGTFLNDVFSFDKELIRDKSDYNLITSIAIHLNLDLQMSVELALHIVRNLHCLFFEELSSLQKSVLSNSFGHEYGIKLFLKSCQAAVTASYIWQVQTNRYANVFSNGTSLFHENNKRHVMTISTR